MYSSPSNVSAVKTISSTVHYNNANDTTRQYDIEADVQISSDKVTNLQNGVIRQKAETEIGNAPSGNFNCSADGGYLGLNFSNATNEQQKGMLAAIQSFKESVIASVTEPNTEE